MVEKIQMKLEKFEVVHCGQPRFLFVIVLMKFSKFSFCRCDSVDQ